MAVVQISDAPLSVIPAAPAEIIAHHLTLRRPKFLVLKNQTLPASVTVRDGRIVRVLRRGSEPPSYTIESLDHRNRRVVQNLTIVNPRVKVGDDVMSVSFSAHQGWIGTVLEVHASYVTVVVTDSGQRHYWTEFVSVTPLRPELNGGDEIPPSPADLAISPWWIERIKRIAAEEGKRRNWCSELDKVVQKLFQPLQKPYYITEVLFTEPGAEDRMAYEVHTPDGVWSAQFASREEADEYLKRKNKNLPPI